VERQITALLCRTSDRRPQAAEGTRELAELLDARIIGTPGEPRTLGWEEDLRASRGCLLEAGGQVDDALAAGRVPILLAGECSVCVCTLPIVVRRAPDVRVLWLDAHPDFNTPATTGSGYLAGMGLAGACGLWDTGFGAGLDPGRVIMHGVRDIDGGERVALDTCGVYRIEDPAQLAGMGLFVHIDLDVIDPDFHPAKFPAPGGLSPPALCDFLAAAAAVATIVGAEITAAAPGYARVAAGAIAPLLAADGGDG
jgi:arginase family enzyme